MSMISRIINTGDGLHNHAQTKSNNIKLNFTGIVIAPFNSEVQNPTNVCSFLLLSIIIKVKGNKP